AVPVVDAEGNLVGVVTKLSLLRLLRPLAASPPTESGMPPQVRDVMDTRAVWVHPADSLDAVVKQMTRHRVRSVPVIERSQGRRQLVGVVSRGDLLRAFNRIVTRQNRPS